MTPKQAEKARKEISMKGTDVTPEQLAHADAFLRESQVQESASMSVTGVVRMVVDRDDLIRLLAWYGAIRAKSGREIPNPLVHRSGPVPCRKSRSGTGRC